METTAQKLNAIQNSPELLNAIRLLAAGFKNCKLNEFISFAYKIDEDDYTIHFTKAKLQQFSSPPFSRDRVRDIVSEILKDEKFVTARGSDYKQYIINKITDSICLRAMHSQDKEVADLIDRNTDTENDLHAEKVRNKKLSEEILAQKYSQTPQVTEWISADTPPEKDHTNVLLLMKSGEIISATYCDDINEISYRSNLWEDWMVITHWMPLPKAPPNSKPDKNK